MKNTFKGQIGVLNSKMEDRREIQKKYVPRD
jgi:hypothetical protein